MNPAQPKPIRPVPSAALNAALQLDLFSAEVLEPVAPRSPQIPPSTRQPGAQTGAPAGAGAVQDPESTGPAAAQPPAPPGRTVDGMRQILLDGQVLAYRFCRSSRRTIGLSIDESGLTITAPRWVPLTEVEATIHEKKRWVVAKLAEMQERRNRPVVPPVRWVDGERLPYLGKHIYFKLASRTGPLHFDAERGVLGLGLPAGASEQQIKDRVQGWLQKQARAIFTERLALYGEKLGVGVAALALSSATTRWGSCSADGRIRLNWRLIHFPLSIIDYVAAHELSHLKEMNHGPRFWQTVASIFPEYDHARDTLREPPPELLPQL